MNQTSLQLLGFTQPQSALPIIDNAQNNAKGFTSRILWYFPTPIYSCLADLELSPEERQIIEDGERILGKHSKIIPENHFVKQNLQQQTYTPICRFS